MRLIGTLRHHQQWLWYFIIAATIVSFLAFFTPDWTRRAGGRGGGGGAVFMINDKPATINGDPIPIEEFREAHTEVFLAHFMRSGGREWPQNDENTRRELDRNAVIRVFLRRKLQEMDIRVSDTAVARATRERLGGLPLANFEKEYLVTHGLTIEDFERFMRSEVGVQQLMGVAGVSGKLVNARDAEQYYRKENQQIITELAIFTATNFLDKVTAKPDEIAKYYSNHMALYRIPERTVVNYAEFPASNHLAFADQEFAKITNLQARIDELYLKMGTNVLKGTNGAPLPEKEAKEKIKSEQRMQLALMEARRKAAEFGDALYNMAEPNRIENFQKLARDKTYQVKTSPAFDRGLGLDENEFPKEFKEQALKLVKDQPIAFRPVIGETAVYVMALKEKVPGELPTLEKVTDKVATDFKADKARDLARIAGTNFVMTVTNALAQGKSFEQACKDAGIEAVKVPAFTLGATTLTNYTEKIPLRSLQQAAAELEPGKATDFRPFFDGGYVVFLKERKPVDEEQAKRELPDFVNRMRRMRQNEALDQWFRKQVDQAKVFIPPHETTPGAPGAPRRG